MSKVTVKVTNPQEVQVWDKVCGIEMARYDDAESRPNIATFQSINGWWVPTEVLNILCTAGYVTREVDPGDALEWTFYGPHVARARYESREVGAVRLDGEINNFSVSDTRFTAAIEAKFKELTEANP